MNLSAVTRIQLGQQFQRIDSPVPNRYLTAGQLIDRLGEQADGVAFAIGANLTQRHRRAENHAADGEQSTDSLEQGGTDVVLGVVHAEIIDDRPIWVSTEDGRLYPASPLVALTTSPELPPDWRS